MFANIPIAFIFSIKVVDTLHLFWKSSMEMNGCFFASASMFLATTSPNPSIELKGGIIVLSSKTSNNVPLLLYKSILEILIPRAVASKANFRH